jgi:glutathionylspermidine amidase/synthetase
MVISLVNNKINFFLLINLTLSLSCYADETPSIRIPSQLPQACRLDCATPYGEKLGIAIGKVVAYSNCNAQCVVQEPYYQKGTYTGIKWQCVEFARRWLLTNQGVVYGDVDIAADIWDKITVVTRVADGKKLTLESYLNGSTQAPQKGDLLIYARAYLRTGHVAVVTKVDLTTGVVQVAEQNFTNQKWVDNNYAREIDLVIKGEQYWLLDAYLLGWKHLHNTI